MYRSRSISGGIFVGFEYEMEAVNRLIEKGFNMVVVDPDVDMLRAENVVLSVVRMLMPDIWLRSIF